MQKPEMCSQGNHARPGILMPFMWEAANTLYRRAPENGAASGYTRRCFWSQEDD